MEIIKLKNYQLEDLEEAIAMMEMRFKIGFEYDELQGLNNFDDLCDLVLEKMYCENDNICTSLIAFNQLRKTISETCSCEIKEITPDTELTALFPKKNRRRLIKNLECRLGYELYLIEPNPYLKVAFVWFAICSFIVLFLVPFIGFAGILTSVVALKCIHRFGRKLRFHTIRDLIKNTLFYNYLDYRKDKNTLNKVELRNIMLDWFSDAFEIEKDKLHQVSFS